MESVSLTINQQLFNMSKTVTFNKYIFGSECQLTHISFILELFNLYVTHSVV